MKSKLIVLTLALAGSVSNASVVAIDLNNDGSFNAYLDAQKGLLWTNGNIFDQFGLTFANAKTAVGALTTEGETGWRLPTMDNFLDLYKTQGTTYTN